MSSILATPSPPHLHPNPRLSPSRSMSNLNPSFSRKRKAEDDEPSDDRMSTSPLPQPRSPPTHQRNIHKRTRTEPVGRPLALPRLLETLDADSLRDLLQQICTRHPAIAQEVEATSPRPSVDSALAVLRSYESILHASFPFGGDRTSDYAYNRVRQSLLQLLDALADFVPHFLPPNATQSSQSLNFLDGATEMLHRIPDWQNFQNTLHKQEAYEEMGRAWVLAIKEASKRAGGMQLKYEGWEQKMQKHNAAAGGRLADAIGELAKATGWMNDGQAGPPSRSDELSSVRQELLSGNYGSGVPIKVGPW